jgi:hypothetical protein
MKPENPKSAREFWDWKFREYPDEYGCEPNDFLRLAAGLLKPGSRILSLGEGEGRNALHLMRLGHRLTCVDVSAVARLRALAAFASSSIDPGIPPVSSRLDGYVLMDLEKQLPHGKWDAVVSIWCHLPPLARQKVHAALPDWLPTGGLYIAEGYSPEQLRFKTGGPTEIDLLYDPEILRTEIPSSMNIEIFQKTERRIQEGSRHQGLSSTIQIVGRKRASSA